MHPPPSPGGTHLVYINLEVVQTRWIFAETVT